MSDKDVDSQLIEDQTESLEFENENESEILNQEAMDFSNWEQAELLKMNLEGDGRESKDLTHEDFEAQIEEDLDSVEDEIEVSAEGTELEGYESAEIEDAEFIDDDRVVSIVESLLFSTDKPMSFAQLKLAFKGTTVNSKQIKRAIELLSVEYAGAQRGVTLEEVNGGFQLRTKIDNVTFLRRLSKARPFKLSGPALEVMAIVAYKQPTVKSEIDEIRGVESGHLLRGLMEKGLVNFAGKSELPGKPMYYSTSRKFLEIFGLRNIRELPSLSEIDDLIPEGIGEEEVKKEKLEDITGDLSRDAGISYSEGEEELGKISAELENITTSSDFFEEEKRREKEKRDRERAQDIRDAMTLGDQVEAKDVKWLERYESALLAQENEKNNVMVNEEMVVQESEEHAVMDSVDVLEVDLIAEEEISLDMNLVEVESEAESAETVKVNVEDEVDMAFESAFKLAPSVDENEMSNNDSENEPTDLSLKKTDEDLMVFNEGFNDIKEDIDKDL